MKEEKRIAVQHIKADWLKKRKIHLDVLRLDEWHLVVSGNKWFKLQYYLREAKEKGFAAVATFGGAYSNHIVATAFACKEEGLQSIGIIRGEKPKRFSHTLLNAEAYGMHLQFVSREEYRKKEELKALFPQAYWINEGGYGELGAAGAANILPLADDWKIYTHIACAVGTGTTLAGLITKALSNQTMIGFSALKNNAGLEGEVRELLSEPDASKPFRIIHDYHFGGYAKYNAALLDYMNDVWKQHHLPLDFVYTAKAFYGLQDMIEKEDVFTIGSRILFIHTGGLQGNESLGNQVLTFS